VAGCGAGLSVPERGRPQAVGQRIPDHCDGGHDGPVGPDPEHAAAAAEGRDAGDPADVTVPQLTRQGTTGNPDE
jgi:hypothetical protein